MAFDRRDGILAEVGPFTIWGWIVFLSMLAVAGAAIKYLIT